jgi:L-asparaginase II
MTTVVEVLRAGAVESQHTVHVAVAEGEGHAVAGCGDASLLTFARSAVKPFQALPLVEDGVLQKYGFGDAELALACASHSGEPEHVELARGMLRRIGSGEEDLACGAHAPFHAASARALRESGAKPGRLHNNCSGKHAGMLALARLHGWPLEGYQEAAHPVQQRMLREMSRWCDVPESEIVVGVDGCGVATFAVPLSALARGFARYATAAAAGGATAHVAGAMAANPHLVAGHERMCTALMEATAGRVLAKVGAEGVYGAMIPTARMGVVLKVADGARRAAEPALLAVLQELGLLRDAEAARLASYAEPPVENTRGEVVGQLRARVRLERWG